MSNQNRNFDIRYRYFSEKCFDISTYILKSGIKKTELRMSKSKFWFRYRNQNHNSDFDIKIFTKSVWTFVRILISLKVASRKSKFLLRYQNRNVGKLKHPHFGEIRIKFHRNFDFVESKKNDFHGYPSSSVPVYRPYVCARKRRENTAY
jgi:hypothetical protein